MRHFEQEITSLKDEDGQEIDRAPHAMMIVTTKVDQPVQPLDMIRKRK